MNAPPSPDHGVTFELEAVARELQAEDAYQREGQGRAQARPNPRPACRGDRVAGGQKCFTASRPGHSDTPDALWTSSPTAAPTGGGGPCGPRLGAACLPPRALWECNHRRPANDKWPMDRVRPWAALLPVATL